MPIDPNHSKTFSPEAVPVLETMIEEYAADKPSSMAPYVQFFTKKFLEPLQRETRRQEVDPMAF